MKYPLHKLTIAMSCILFSSMSFADTPQPQSGTDVLSGFNKLWISGDSLATGKATPEGQAILDKNLSIVRDIAKNRTKQQEFQAFAVDFQKAGYMLTGALGPLKTIVRAEANSQATIDYEKLTSLDGLTATTAKDSGNGIGDNTSGQLGKLLDLRNAIAKNASSNPPKNKYKYPRPFIQKLNGEDLSWVLEKPLVDVGRASAGSEGGFPSGHTNESYWTGLTLAYVIPQQYSDLVLKAGEMGYNRVVAGIHSPLDVIGGRMHATYIAINGLASNPDLRKAAYTQAQAFLSSQCGGSVDGCYQNIDLNQLYNQYQVNKALYDKYTFVNDFPSIGSTTATPVVPKNAELLIETRYPYLSVDQQREILLTTSNKTGSVLDNGMGYDTLNLYKAGNGYGAFNQKTTINMDAQQGGYSASDIWLNDINGTGSLEKSGTGTLTLAGHNSWTGGTTVLAGKLVGSNGQSFGQGGVTLTNASLEMNTANNDTLTNTLISDTNSHFYKKGSGSLTYNGDGSNFKGTTHIQNGVLNVQSNLNGTTVVENNGTLSGNGQLQSLQVLQGGTVDLSQNTNRLNVMNDLVMNQGSTLKVMANSGSSNASGIDVKGATKLNGGNVLQVGVNSNYNLLSEYTILTAQQGITGKFDKVSSAYAFLTPKINYNNNAVTLQLLRNDQSFNSVAENNNQYQIASSLDRLGLGNALYNLVAKQTTDQARQSFQALSGEGYASLGINATQDLLTSGESLISHEYQKQPLVWMNSYAKSIQNSGKAVADSKYSNYGALAGVEIPLSDKVNFGATLGQGRGTSKVSARDFTAKDNNTEVGFYGRYVGDYSGSTVGLVGRWGDVSVDRNINFTNMTKHATADLDTQSVQAFGEYWKNLDTQVPLTPYIRLSHVMTQINSFKEQNAGIAGLSGNKSTINTTFSTLGVRSEYKLPLESQNLAIQAGLGWRHAFGDLNSKANLSLNGSQSSYKVVGTSLAEDTGLIDLGIKADLTQSLEMGVNYSGQFSKDMNNNSGTLSLKYKF